MIGDPMGNDRPLHLGGAFSSAGGTISHGYAILPLPACCGGDVDGSGQVNVDDLLALINSWGTCADPVDCPADLVPPGGNGVVNVDDLLDIINGWGSCL